MSTTHLCKGEESFDGSLAASATTISPATFSLPRSSFHSFDLSLLSLSPKAQKLPGAKEELLTLKFVRAPFSLHAGKWKCCMWLAQRIIFFKNGFLGLHMV